MLLATTCGHRSPKVLMISAVCGRAPPAIVPPNAPPAPPLWAAMDQDWLSVIKTRALSASELIFAFSWAKIPDNHKNGNEQARTTTKVFLIRRPSGHKNLQMSGKPWGKANYPLARGDVNSNLCRQKGSASRAPTETNH